MNAIILAGGLGTRLRSVISGIPKPMAPINGKPFLEYLLLNLLESGITKLTLSLGHQHNVIQDYFCESFHGMPIQYVIEKHQLGTGGAAYKALANYSSGDPVFIFNGDTFMDLNLKEMFKLFLDSSTDVGIALKKLPNTSRYGRVVLDAGGMGIQSFEEKGVNLPGLINAGIYIMRASFFEKFDFPEIFSLEKDCFVEKIQDISFSPFTSDGYFIDIGIPSDYMLAQKDRKHFNLDEY